MTPVVTEPEYLTQGGLAELFHVSVRTVQRKARHPDFPRPICIGRCYRWSRAEVEEFLRRNREESDASAASGAKNFRGSSSNQQEQRK